MTPLLIIGTFHFASAKDMVNLDPGDMSTPGRQAELDALAADLAGFAPTKVLIEHPYAERDQIDASYRAFLAGIRPLAASEREQLGFRIAAHAGHGHVYPVDIMHRFTEPAFEALIGGEGAAAERFRSLLEPSRAAVAATEHTLTSRGVRAALAGLNTPQARRDSLAVYLDGFCRIAGNGDAAYAGAYAGADVTGNWYHRNVRIFASVLRVTEPGDRLLMLYGAGHVPILAHLAEASGAYQLADPSDILAGPSDILAG